MTRTHWRQFIGLPHRTGADPRTEDAADCLLVAFAVLDELALPHPPVDPQWFAMAQRGEWNKLADAFHFLTIPSDPGDGAVSMTEAGILVGIGGGALLTRHHGGVRWAPTDLLGSREWRRFL
jgi:hypothetical protein